MVLTHSNVNCSENTYSFTIKEKDENNQIEFDLELEGKW